MAYETILFDVANRIATITLNRPQELNAMSEALFSELQHALAALPATDARVVVLTGAGRGFCSGASLSSNGLVDVEQGVRTGLNPLMIALDSLEIPLITAVNGAAAGAGCSLALAGDIVIACRSAFFMHAFTNVGLISDGGSSWSLPRMIGMPRAMRMMLLAERIPAELAEQWGMLSFLVDDDALMAETMKIATHFANGPTQSYRMVRRAVRAGLDGTLLETLDREAVNQGVAGRTYDHAEGKLAFQEKRKPQFQGK